MTKTVDDLLTFHAAKAVAIVGGNLMSDHGRANARDFAICARHSLHMIAICGSERALFEAVDMLLRAVPLACDASAETRPAWQGTLAMLTFLVRIEAKLDQRSAVLAEAG